jgi:hypothetical protein
MVLIDVRATSRLRHRKREIAARIEYNDGSGSEPQVQEKPLQLELSDAPQLVVEEAQEPNPPPLSRAGIRGIC